MTNLITRPETFITKESFNQLLSDLNATKKMPIKTALLSIETLNLSVLFNKRELIVDPENAEYMSYEHVGEQKDNGLHPEIIISIIKKLANHFNLSTDDKLSDLEDVINTNIIKFDVVSIFAGDNLLSQLCTVFTQDGETIPAETIVHPHTTQKLGNYQINIKTSSNTPSDLTTNVHLDIKVNQLFGHIQHAEATVDFKVTRGYSIFKIVNITENPELLSSFGIEAYAFN